MPEFSINQFIDHLKRDDLKSLYLIWGPEIYFHDILLSHLEKKVIPDAASKSFNYHLYYANDSSIDEIVASCLSFPMLSDKKLVIIKNSDKILFSSNESFKKYIQNPQKSTVLVLTAKSLKNKAISEFKKKAISVHCKTLYEKEIYKWVKSKFNDNNIVANEESIAFLIENIGFDLLRLNVEIEKIKNLLSDGQNLSKDLIQKITGFSKEVNVFNLQNLLGKKDLKNALKIGLKLIEQGEALASMLPMIFLFFKRMWIVKEMLKLGKNQKQILADLGGNAFYYRDIFNYNTNFSNSNFREIFEYIEQSDLLLKTSQKREDSILTMIIYKICKI